MPNRSNVLEVIGSESSGRQPLHVYPHSSSCKSQNVYILPSYATTDHINSVISMSFKPIPPIRGGMSINARDADVASITSNATTASSKDLENNLAKKIWCETQWTTLSIQAKNLGLPKLPYFDPQTMLLSKEVNGRLWRQLVCE